ncbi:hypothetical protein TUN205_12067, partial [Pyrenophora tritici-repentis]
PGLVWSVPSDQTRPDHSDHCSGVIQDLPIALPHLAGSHTGDAIADTIKKTLQEYSIGSDKLGYFVLDNAANNDTAVSSLAHAYDFNAAHQTPQQSID